MVGRSAVGSSRSLHSEALDLGLNKAIDFMFAPFPEGRDQIRLISARLECPANEVYEVDVGRQSQQSIRRERYLLAASSSFITCYYTSVFTRFGSATWLIYPSYLTRTSKHFQLEDRREVRVRLQSDRLLISLFRGLSRAEGGGPSDINESKYPGVYTPMRPELTTKISNSTQTAQCKRLFRDFVTCAYHSARNAKLFSASC